MVWLNPDDREGQEYVELRLNAPIGEKFFWSFSHSEIEQDLNRVSDEEKTFLMNFLAWLKEALKHTSIIAVEGNL